MNNVIYVDFKRGRMSLKEAKKVLGSFFKQALFEWSIEKLEHTIAESWLSGADIAYEEVLRFRLARSAQPGPLAEVIKLAA